MPRIPNTDERTQPTEGAICSCRCRSCCRANSNACARCDISADSTKAATPTTTTATATATQQQRSNGSRCVDSALYGPRVVAKNKRKKKLPEELAVASDWLLNSLTTLDATRLLDSGSDQATQANADADADADADTNVDRHPFSRVASYVRRAGKVAR